jgi:hypothetical protein
MYRNTFTGSEINNAEGWGGGGGLILAELQNYVLQTHSFSVKDLTACIRPSFLDGGDGM